MKELLLNEVSSIDDFLIRSFVTAALSRAPEAFFRIPASTTGMNHPPQSQGEGGLIRHTLMVLRTVGRLCESYTEPAVDVVKAAAILHDIGKAMFKPHEIVAADWLSAIARDLGVESSGSIVAIIEAVRWHMGPWSVGGCLADSGRENASRFPEDFSRVSQIVHLADYFVGCRSIGWLEPLGTVGARVRVYATVACNVRCGTCGCTYAVVANDELPICCGQYMATQPE